MQKKESFSVPPALEAVWRELFPSVPVPGDVETCVRILETPRAPEPAHLTALQAILSAAGESSLNGQPSAGAVGADSSVP